MIRITTDNDQLQMVPSSRTGSVQTRESGQVVHSEKSRLNHFKVDWTGHCETFPKYRTFKHVVKDTSCILCSKEQSTQTPQKWQNTKASRTPRRTHEWTWFTKTFEVFGKFPEMSFSKICSDMVTHGHHPEWLKKVSVWLRLPETYEKPAVLSCRSVLRRQKLLVQS